MKEFFPFRTIWKLTPTIQILIIIGLYLATVVWGYFEYQQTGLFLNFPLHTFSTLVPIYEEIIFRGVILGILIKHFSGKKSILLSSLLFGLWHVRNAFYLDAHVIPQILYAAFILGPLFGWLTLKTKTLWPAVILHYVNNILAGISGYLLMVYF